MELHEVIDGNGTCRLKDEVVDYRSGTMAVIPVGEHHRVEAGDDGLTLLAKFVPSLV
ncbi:AraC family ligand binding domain-containing protein [Desulfatiferula olefinivorans]